MKKLFFLLIAFTLILSCSSDETSTPVTPPPAPIAKYTITLSAGEGGTVSTTGGEFDAGQTVSVTATPQGEYVFTSWSDGNTDATRTITVSSNSTLTANFEKRKYPLTLNIEGEGEVLEEIVNAGRTTDYDSGTTLKLTALPAEGWEFVAWTGAIESTELEVQLLVSEAKEVNAEFAYNPLFVSIGPNYSYPNNTIGDIAASQFVRKEFMSNAIRELYVNQGQLGTSNRYSEWNQGVFFDYDNDNRLDYFTFIQYFGYNPGWASKKGKLVLVNDIFGINPKSKVIDDNDFYFGANVQLNDFDGDGKMEIIVGFSNGHKNGNETYGYEIPPRIYYFSQNGDISYKNLFEEGRGQHDFATGDVDNDGDIDILFWEYSTVEAINIGEEKYRESHFSRPILFLNNGYGVFSRVYGNENFIGLDEILKSYPYQFVGLSVDLFDLNNDGVLDLISGENYRVENQTMSSGMRVSYGLGNGVFDIENSIILKNTSLVGGKNYIPLGATFGDLNGDGQVDIVFSGSPEYNNGFIFSVFIQNSNGSFTDMTESIMDNYEVDGNGNQYNETTKWVNACYSPKLLDVDNDGDLDLLADGITPHYDIGYANSHYWINNNGFFNMFID